MWNFLAPLGFAYLGIVAIGLIVLWTGYRKRERWAWYVMLIALLFFYFPSSVLPVALQIRRFGWLFLLELLGAFRVGGWGQCWIGSLRPNYSVGLACMPILILSGPLKFLVMLVALLLPVKAFFWHSEPPQPGAQTKIAAPSKTKTWVWGLALLSVIALVVAFMVRSLMASSQNKVAEIQHMNATIFAPYNMVAVALAKAENAVAMPDAGRDDAIVVALVRDGAVFLGPVKVDPAQLGSRIRDNRTDRTGETMYLRADARAQYRDVEKVIDAMRSAGAEEVGLVTQRKVDAQLENSLWIGNPLLKSVGLEVSFPSPAKTPARGSSPPGRTIVVRVIYRPNAAPAYKINAADVAHADLQSRLNEIFANRAERVMFIKGDDNLNFSDIAEVIDIGRASNVDHIGLMTPGFTAGN
jgi:biopolymer transport protein ExbD